MAKIKYSTLVNRLVEHYYNDDLTADEAQTLLTHWQAKCDQEMEMPIVDWNYFFGNSGVFARLEKTIYAYFSSRHYDWLLAEYKQLKKELK